MPERQEEQSEVQPEFWNPYRFVTIGDEPIQHRTPTYRHCLAGRHGRITGVIEALTPVLIGDGKDLTNIQFIKRPDGTPFIPGTSLKGMARSLAELIGNAAVPTDKSLVDERHQYQKAAVTNSGDWQLDIAARLFGMMDRASNAQVFAGLVQFHDALLQADSMPAGQWPSYHLTQAGQPKREHRAFYGPAGNRRKFYHHKPSGEIVVGRHDRTIHPAPKGAKFDLRVDYRNLRDEELGLLLYCLVLEEASVELSQQALGGRQATPVTICGPMCQKIGAAKAHGAGSIRIRLTHVTSFDPASRYRASREREAILEGEALEQWVGEQTASIVARRDRTMQELRAMLIFDAGDPRGDNLHYPSRQWFDDEANKKTSLKPPM